MAAKKDTESNLSTIEAKPTKKKKASPAKKTAAPKAKSSTTKIAKTPDNTKSKKVTAKSTSTAPEQEIEMKTDFTGSAKKKTASTTRRKMAIKPAISESERYCMIEEAAYYIAEARGFNGGDPLQDWLMAEVKVNQILQNSIP